MKKPGSSQAKASSKECQFHAEAEYADSMLRSALGDGKGSVAALRRALEWKPTYAPALLSMGSVEYQQGRRAAGRRLFRALLSLPKNTPDLCAIIDEAGSFLIQIGVYKDGLALYRAAVERFPAVAVVHQGLGCCAGHEGFYDEAVAASVQALQLEPANQKFVNDLGWTLVLAGRLGEAESKLERAVSMDPSDELARENLRICKDQSSRRCDEINEKPLGGNMAKLGTQKRPAVVRVRSVAEGEDIVSFCTARGWQVIVGVEPDEPEDTSDVEKLLSGGGKTASAPRLPPKISGNDYCPCGSGKKFKKCCGAA